MVFLTSDMTVDCLKINGECAGEKRESLNHRKRSLLLEDSKPKRQTSAENLKDKGMLDWKWIKYLSVQKFRAQLILNSD